MIKYCILFLFLLAGLGFVSAQKVESKLSLNTVSVGEEFSFYFEIECQEKDVINYLPNKKALFALRAHTGKTSLDSLKLELLSPFKEKKEKIQGKTYWTGEYSLICFDTGYLILQPITVKVNEKNVQIPPALLRVNLVAKNKNIDIYDIEESFAVIPDPKTDWLGIMKIVGLWLLLLICLVALIYFVFIRGKKKAEDPSLERKLTSHEKTIQGLNALMKKQMWKNDREKEHFTEMSLIIRKFLNEEFNNRFEGKTSFEIQIILRKNHFSSKQLNDLGLILNVSDMVKFAKSSVEEEGVQSIYRKAIDFVNETDNK
jgi:hypothetical protein